MYDQDQHMDGCSCFCVRVLFSPSPGVCVIKLFLTSGAAVFCAWFCALKLCVNSVAGLNLEWDLCTAISYTSHWKTNTQQIISYYTCGYRMHCMNSRPNICQKQLAHYRSILLLEVYVHSERMITAAGLVMKHHGFLFSEASSGFTASGHEVCCSLHVVLGRGAEEPVLWGLKSSPLC